MDEVLKEELRNRFRDYLDDCREPEDDGEPVDLLSLYEELGGLKNEVRIESRQIKTALDDFRSAFAALDAANQDVSSRFAGLQEEKKGLERLTLKPVVAGLLDMYDRLSAAAGQSQPEVSFFAGWLCRRQTEWINAQLQGWQMSLARVRDVLAMCGVLPIETADRRFDPVMMKAVGMADCNDKPDGAVVEELRKGFVWNGEVVRPAEVVVNKRKSQV